MQRGECGDMKSLECISHVSRLNQKTLRPSAEQAKFISSPSRTMKGSPTVLGIIFHQFGSLIVL